MLTTFKEIFEPLLLKTKGNLYITNSIKRRGMDYYVKIEMDKLTYLEETPQKNSRVEINFTDNSLLLNNQPATPQFSLEFKKKLKSILDDIRNKNAICRKGTKRS
jgi:hypothetical protein